MILYCPSRNSKRYYSDEYIPMDMPFSTNLIVRSREYNAVVSLYVYIQPYYSVSGCNAVLPICLFGQLYSDGLCKPLCEETSGCDLNRMMCPDGLFVDIISGYNETNKQTDS